MCAVRVRWTSGSPRLYRAGWPHRWPYRFQQTASGGCQIQRWTSQSRWVCSAILKINMAMNGPAELHVFLLFLSFIMSSGSINQWNKFKLKIAMCCASLFTQYSSTEFERNVYRIVFFPLYVGSEHDLLCKVVSRQLQITVFNYWFITVRAAFTSHGYHCHQELSPLQFNIYCCVRELKNEQCPLNSPHFKL